MKKIFIYISVIIILLSSLAGCKKKSKSEIPKLEQKGEALIGYEPQAVGRLMLTGYRYPLSDFRTIEEYSEYLLSEHTDESYKDRVVQDIYGNIFNGNQDGVLEWIFAGPMLDYSTEKDDAYKHTGKQKLTDLKRYVSTDMFVKLAKDFGKCPTEKTKSDDFDFSQAEIDDYVNEGNLADNFGVSKFDFINAEYLQEEDLIKIYYGIEKELQVPDIAFSLTIVNNESGKAKKFLVKKVSGENADLSGDEVS